MFSRDTRLPGRILNTFAEPDKTKIASYVLGAVLQNDMEAVKNSSALKCDADTTVVIYGKNPLREALMDLFAKENFFRHVTEFIPKDSVPTSAKGALHIVSLTEKNK